MNIGVLIKLKVLSGTMDELINQVQAATRLNPAGRHVETLFYLSANDSQEFYTFSLWHSLQDLQEIQQNVKKNLLPVLQNRAKLLEQHFFRLKWEYRLLPQPVEISTLRILTFPPDFLPTRRNEIMESIRQQRGNIPNIIGLWAGVSMENDYMVLYRFDWNSKQAQQKMFNSAMLNNSLAIGKGGGIKIEFASSNLQEIFQSDENNQLFLPET